MKAKEQPKEAQKEKSCQNGLPNFLGGTCGRSYRQNPHSALHGLFHGWKQRKKYEP